jgi:hypothetical protein
LNHPTKKFASGWFIPNYDNSKNPFVLMWSGMTTIDNSTTWHIFVDQKLLACGKGMPGLNDNTHSMPVLAILTVPNDFTAKDERECSAMIGSHPDFITIGPYNYD